jgi:transposase
LEAGPLSQWLFSALAEAGLPVICVETRHMQAVLKAQINKTDRNDARGIAQMMRRWMSQKCHFRTHAPQQSAFSIWMFCPIARDRFLHVGDVTDW